MDIRYFEPLSKGFDRMRRALFHPFDPRKWFVVGFTAFLAGLTDGHGGGGSGSGGKWRGRSDLESILYFPQRAWEWLLDNPVWFTLIAIGIALLLTLAVILVYLSARGKFMFLDNVVYDRAQIVKPWHEYKAEGNSLFLWTLCFGLIAVTIIILYVIGCYFIFLDLYEGYARDSALIASGIWMVLGFVVLFLLTSYIGLLLSDFVVPIMYRYRISTVKAWQRFLPLFSSHFLNFLGYGFLILFLIIPIALGIIIAGFLTCCIGFILLMVPYINSVVLLPISYTFRAFSVEFLEQFGPNYHIFPRPVGGNTDEKIMPV
jgi:hypothetical protein